MKAQNLNQLLAWQPPAQEYIISHGILVPQTKLVLYGRWQTWKSMLATHMAFTIASGLPWFGFTTTQSSTYTLQIEIPKAQYQKRVIKFVAGNNLHPDNIYFRSEYYMKLDKAPNVADMKAELLDSASQVLILDPAYKIITGKLVDEADIRRLEDELDRLISDCKIAVVLIHHTRKVQIVDGQVYESPDDMFGQSILADWADTMIRTNSTRIDRNTDRITLSFDKVRHAEEALDPVRIDVTRSNLTFKVV